MSISLKKKKKCIIISLFHTYNSYLQTIYELYYDIVYTYIIIAYSKYIEVIKALDF